MTTVSYEVFLPDVMQYCPDVADFVALNAIKQSCIEFCERTRFLQTDLDPITGIAGVSNYEIGVDNGTKFVDIVEAWYNDVLLIPKSVEEITRIYRRSDWRDLQGGPVYLTREIPTEVILVPAPEETLARALNMRVAVAPTRASTTVDSSIYEEYYEIICFGARARIYDTPKQSYYDRDAAMKFEKKFRVGITDARTRISRGMSRSSNVVEPVRFT